jgi:hypothetical protein
VRIDAAVAVAPAFARVFLVGALTPLSSFSTVAVTAVAATRGKTPRSSRDAANDFAPPTLARDL